MGFAVWGALKSVVGARSPKNHADLISRFQEAWKNVLTPDFVRNFCANTWRRPQAVINADGGHIE